MYDGPHRIQVQGCDEVGCCDNTDGANGGQPAYGDSPEARGVSATLKDQRIALAGCINHVVWNSILIFKSTVAESLGSRLVAKKLTLGYINVLACKTKWKRLVYTSSR